MAKKAIVIYGPPGAGKGTQANLLAWTKNFIHFDTGKYLEQVVHDPENQKDPAIAAETKLFDTGALLTPSFVLKVTTDKTREVAKAGYSIAFSGSPRTLFEAFGDEKNTGLVSVLEKEYGKDSVHFVFLEIEPEASIARNKVRQICVVCGTGLSPFMYKDIEKHSSCPICGAGLRKRTLDNPAVFKTRIKEYEERTKPIMAELKKRGYKVTEVDGRPLPFEVFADIKKRLSL